MSITRARCRNDRGELTIDGHTHPNSGTVVIENEEGNTFEDEDGNTVAATVVDNPGDLTDTFGDYSVRATLGADNCPVEVTAVFGTARSDPVEPD